MQAARDNVDVRENMLGVQIGPTRWLLDLQEIGEIVPTTTITQVPLTQDWYLGLLNIRGNLISVIDFSRYQGLGATEIENASRIVTFATSLGINCGLLVSRVMGLRNVAEMQRQTDTTDNASEWIGSSYRDNDSQDWVTLSLSSIAQEQRFLHIGL
jgi:twitching motility protein PilI